MTTIRFNDPMIEQIIKQEGLENITNELKEYIKNKFYKKNSTTHLNDLDSKIKNTTKTTNKQKAIKIKNAIEGLNSLIDDDIKKISVIK